MIDVLKRLAELDDKNPNIVKESTQVDECGMMPDMGMMSAGHEHPPIPANISLNASGASGEEVADILSTIMTLAGVHKVGPADLGIHGDADEEPLIGTPEGPAPTAGDEMRSVIDKLNPDDEETDETVDNTGADPQPPHAHDSNEFARQENPDGGDRMDGTMPKAFVSKTMEQITKDLMSDYQQFIQES